jgi:hypothetical protein
MAAATTKRKAQTKAPVKSQKQAEDAAEYFKKWHPLTYAVVVWALLWLGTGFLHFATLVLGLLFHMGGSLPWVPFWTSVGVALLIGPGGSIAWWFYSRGEKAKAAAEIAKRQRILLAEVGLPDPGAEAIQTQVEKADERIAKVRDAFETVCHTSSLQALKPGEDEKTIPKLSDVRCTVDLDVTAELVTEGGNGITIDDIRENHRRFAEVAGAKRVKVRRKGNSLGRATITFLYTDPLERFNYVRDLRRPTTPGNLVIGVDENDAPMELPSDKPILLGGYQGSGKSSISWAALASLAQQGVWTELYVIDPKEMELAAWKPLVGKGWLPNRIKVVAYAGEEKDDGLDVIEQAYEAMQDRARRFGAFGVQNAVTEVENSPENPYVLVINDEIGDYMVEEKKGSTITWGRLKQKARAVGVNVMASAITVNDSEMGAGRKLYGTRVGLRAEEGTGIALFGKDAVARGAELHRIPIGTPGVGFCVNPETGEMVRFRAAFVSKADCARIVEGLLPEGMGSGFVEEEPAGEWPVYWRRSSCKRSLYVGKGDPDTRWLEHKHKDWAVHDDPANLVVWYKDTEAEQLEWERLMIEAKKPIYNVQHNLGNPMRREWKDGQFEPLDVEPAEVLEEFDRRIKPVRPRLAAVRRAAKRREKPATWQQPPVAEDVTVLEPDGVVTDDGLLTTLRPVRPAKSSRRVRVPA